MKLCDEFVNIHKNKNKHVRVRVSGAPEHWLSVCPTNLNAQLGNAALWLVKRLNVVLQCFQKTYKA